MVKCHREKAQTSCYPTGPDPTGEIFPPIFVLWYFKKKYCLDKSVLSQVTFSFKSACCRPLLIFRKPEMGDLFARHCHPDSLSPRRCFCSCQLKNPTQAHFSKRGIWDKNFSISVTFVSGTSRNRHASSSSF